jgi:thiamine biosynthesis protein ThiS
VATGATVADVLRLLDLDPRTIVVEHNREIVRDRATLGQRTLRSDDVLELVHFVGGG